MRKLCLWLLVLSLALGIAVVATAQAQEQQPRNIILIGWDGAQRAHVKEALTRGELPHVKQLASEGSLVAIDILRVTDTKAGWTQILTGYEPEVTGVFSNNRFQPVPKGYTVFERLEKHFGADKFVTVAVIGKKGNVDAAAPRRIKLKDESQKPKAKKKQPATKALQQPATKATQQKAGQQKAQQQAAKKQKQPQGKIITENGIKYRLVPGKPYFHTKDSMDVFINGLKEDEKVCSRTLELLTKYRDRPFFFFVHFAEVDHKGHKFGENSKEYNDALISADTCTGRIVEKLKELKLYGQTLIYVAADHGFDEGMKTHRDAPYVFLATNDRKVMRRGERADITPTILERFGLELSKLEPPLDGHSLARPYTAPVW